MADEKSDNAAERKHLARLARAARGPMLHPCCDLVVDYWMERLIWHQRKPGSMAVCLACSAVLQFDEAVRLTLPDPEMLAIAQGDPERGPAIQKLINDARTFAAAPRPSTPTQH
jgi:hypothetical protein